MAGASVSLLKLDAELVALLEHPCRTPALVVGQPASSLGSAVPRRTPAPQAEEPGSAGQDAPLLGGGEITPSVFRSIMTACAEAMASARDELSALDGATGDGDHGVTMEAGWRAVRTALAAQPPEASIARLCRAASSAFLDSVGASAGPLYATGFARAADAVAQRRDLDAPSLLAWVEAMAAGIQERGGAVEGDKTMFDAWSAAAKAARAALSEDRDASVHACLVAASRGAVEGRDATATMQARRGRAAKLGARSLGHLDAGAASAALLLAAFRDGFDRARRLTDEV
jgi:dihydroxyacetone kinase